MARFQVCLFQNVCVGRETQGAPSWEQRRSSALGFKYGYCRLKVRKSSGLQMNYSYLPRGLNMQAGLTLIFLEPQKTCMSWVHLERPGGTGAWDLVKLVISHRCRLPCVQDVPAADGRQPVDLKTLTARVATSAPRLHGRKRAVRTKQCTPA